jgi:elongation factor Ts
MPEITAKLVNELRSKTGQGMMECKKMLAEHNGDIDKAIEGFRKKGVKASVSERAATEGRIIIANADDRKSAAIVEINCNTDFTARSEPVLKLGAQAAQLVLHNPGTDVQQAANISASITDVSQQTGENVRIGRTARLENPSGVVGSYLYSVTGKIGVLVSLSGSPSEELIRDLCLHIIAKDPLALNREGLSPEVVASERDIAIDQAKQTGKPQNIAEKIAEGKMRTFYEERVLLDQKFVKDDSKSITDLLKAGNATLEKFIRLEVGKG